MGIPDTASPAAIVSDSLPRTLPWAPLGEDPWGAYRNPAVFDKLTHTALAQEPQTPQPPTLMKACAPHPTTLSAPVRPFEACCVPSHVHPEVCRGLFPGSMSNKLLYFNFPCSLLLNRGSPSNSPEFYLTNVNLIKSQRPYKATLSPETVPLQYANCSSAISAHWMDI